MIDSVFMSTQTRMRTLCDPSMSFAAERILFRR